MSYCNNFFFFFLNTNPTLWLEDQAVFTQHLISVYVQSTIEQLIKLRLRETTDPPEVFEFTVKKSKERQFNLFCAKI